MGDEECSVLQCRHKHVDAFAHGLRLDGTAGHRLANEHLDYRVLNLAQRLPPQDHRPVDNEVPLNLGFRSRVEETSQSSPQSFPGGRATRRVTDEAQHEVPLDFVEHGSK